MKEQDKQEFKQIINEGFEQLVLPQFDRIYHEMATKKELREVKESLEEKLDAIENDVGNIGRKLDAEIDWRDKASKRLKTVEAKLGFAK